MTETHALLVRAEILERQIHEFHELANPTLEDILEMQDADYDLSVISDHLADLDELEHADRYDYGGAY